MLTLETVLAAVDAAGKLIDFATSVKGTFDQADQATIESRLADAIARRHAQQAQTDAALDEAAKR